MSEVTLTLRVKVKLLGLTGFYESEQKAEALVRDTLSQNDRVCEIILIRTDSVANSRHSESD